MTVADALVGIDGLVQRTAVEHHCPSISWGIVINGALAHVGCHGRLHDGRRPTEDTVYRIASMTKSFTAAAVLALRDEGVLSLDDPLHHHAPELAVIEPEWPGAASVRLRDLLSMSAGLATDDAWADRHLDISDGELDRALAAGVIYAGEPGSTYEYSNLGYGLLGRVVKRVTGRSVQETIDERFLAPLGLDRTTWVRPDHDDWAHPYLDSDGEVVAEAAPLGDGALAAMGGLWSTVTDIARWIAWLDDAFTRGPEVVAAPLSRASRREMQQVQRYIGMACFAGRTIASGYGYGLRVRDDPRLGTVITHSGGLPGYGSTMRWLSARRLGVVALANTTYAPMTELAQSIVELVADHDGLPPAPVVDAVLVEALGRRLLELLTVWDDRVAHELFTDNVALDEPYERRRGDASRWLDACGGRLEIDHVETTSATSGRLVLVHPGTPLHLEMQVAPVRPPRLQTYTFALAER